MQLSLGGILNAVLCFGGPPLWAALTLLAVRRRSQAAFFGGWICGCIAEMIANALDVQILGLIASAASLILAAVLWWLSRRRRKRAPKLAGAKSKARLAALVRTLRERTVPRPVYRPQPQGA